MPEKVAIVGSGLIGSSWAAIFASGGFNVVLYDISEEQLVRATANVARNLQMLEEKGLKRSNLSQQQAIALVTPTSNLAEAVKGAVYVQESTMESVEAKKSIFKQLDQVVDDNTILASSSSTIPASKFTEELTHRSQCLIAHPVNPPLYLPLTELVPAPWTSPDIVDAAARILSSVGQAPVRLKKEVLGFAVNRLQYALLAESWRLIADDVLDVVDLDKVMSSGLGPRYAFHGPMTTTHLNAAGVRDYYTRYSAGIRKVLDDFGPNPTFEESDVIEKLGAELEKEMPVTELSKHTAHREECLARIASLKKQL